MPRFARAAGGARVILKREDLNHTGSHKINNVLGQALLTKRIGKSRVIAETGAGTTSRIPDAEFAKAGAAIGKAADAGRADVVLKVRRPTDAEVKGYRKGAAVLATMDPYGHEAAVARGLEAGFDRYLVKPVDPDKLSALLATT